MKNYRIKKVEMENGGYVRYYPQVKFLGLFWCNMFDWSNYYEGFHSYEEANKELCGALRGPMVEYLDVNCEELKNG